MPRGTNFVCNSLECEEREKKISIHGPFPIATIKEIMSLPKIVEDPSHYANLAEKARDGREYAVIPIPNETGIKPKGIRVQYYSLDLKMIFDVDLLWGKDDERIKCHISGEDDSEAISKRIGIKVKGLNKLVEEGFPCPSCGRVMESKDWLTNTGVSDWGDPNASKGS